MWGSLGSWYFRCDTSVLSVEDPDAIASPPAAAPAQVQARSHLYFVNPPLDATVVCRQPKLPLLAPAKHCTKILLTSTP